MPAAEISKWGGTLSASPGSAMPALTALKNGSYLATWVDEATGKIEAQVVGADNLPKTDKFTVASGGALKNPSVTALKDGGIVITWENETAISVHAAVINVKADGSTEIRKAPFQVAVPNIPVNNHSNPSVTALDSGGFAISVTDRFSTSETDTATTFVYDSNGSYIRTDGFTAFNRTKDTAITAVQDGKAYVTVVSAARQSTTDARYELTAKLYSASGGESKSILISDGSGAAPSFAVETLEDGRFIVVWSQFNAFKARIYKPDGAVDGDVLQLYTSGDSQVLNISNISVKAVKSGFAVVFQQNKTSDSDVHLATFTLTGEPKGTARLVHTASASIQESPTLTTLADGRIAVSWKDLGVTPSRVQIQIFDERQSAVSLSGTSGNDHFYGSALNDTLIGGNGDDALDGGAGNDYFEANEDPDDLGNYRGTDIFTGGVGDRDQVSYWNVTNENQIGVKIYLSQEEYNGGAAEGDSFISIEVIDGTHYADVIEGDGNVNIFWGDTGNDTLAGGGNNDELNGADGDDVLDGGVIIGLVPDNDTLIGHSGDDFMWGRGGGNDVFDGGEGVDKVSYFGAAGIQLYMQRQTDGTVVATGASRGAAAGDVFRSIEIVDGTTQADTIEGTTGAQVFWGAQGADVLKGHDGNDELNGGDHNDTLSGGAGGDRLVGEAGFDWASYAEAASGVSVSLASGQGLAGEAAGDILIGLEGLLGSRFDDTLAGGAHELHGGLGNDTYQVGAGTLVVEGAGGGVDTVVASGSYSLAPSAEVEVLRLAAGGGLEAYSLTGSNAANAISGNAGANALTGLDGDDTLTGETGNDVIGGDNGNDRLVGGLGKDTVTGGTGRDVFAFGNKDTGSSKTKADYIADFKGREGDRLDLKAVDANTTKKGDQAFSFIGKSAFTKAGQVRYEKTKKETYVYLNTDSDKAAEAVIKLKGAIDFSKSWFVL